MATRTTTTLSALGEFWHVIGTCRFESGDMDSYLPAVRQLCLNAEF